MVRHQAVLKTVPSVCKCKSCDCAIYTYEESGVCKACKDGQHLSGAQRKDYSQSEQDKDSKFVQ